MKQIRVSKTCMKRNVPATTKYLQNLMIKLPRLHTRPLAILQSKPRTMQNDWLMLLAEWPQPHADLGDMHTVYEAVYRSSHQIQACLHSTDRRLSDQEAILCLMLVRTFQRPLQWATHCAGVFTFQDSPSGCEAGACWSTPHKHKRKATLQLKAESHLTLMASKQKSVSMREKQG